MSMANFSKSHALANYVVPTIGLGSYWAWMNLSASNAALYPWLVESVYPFQLMVSSCAYLVAMAVLFCLSGRLRAGRTEHVLIVLACLASFAGSLLVVAGETLFPMVLTCGNVIVASGTAVMLVYWGVLLSTCGPKASATMAIGSFVVGFSLYLALTALPSDGLTLAALPVLLAVCGGSLLHSRKRGTRMETRREDGSIPRRVLAVFASLLVCVLLNEMIRIVSTPLAVDEFSQVGRFTQIGGLVVACVALLALACSKKRFGFNTMSRFLLPLMIAGFLSFLVFDDDGFSIMFVVLGAGYWCLQLLILIALCDAVSSLGLSAVRCFALSYGAMQVAIVAAKPLGSVVSDLLRGLSSGLSLIVSVAVLIVVVLAMFVLRDGGAGFSGRSGQAAARTPERSGFNLEWLNEIACEFGLSPRETEVFRLLARGRSLPVVTKELNIAKGTAQTHVRHIYEKMGVHARQELLDLIEERSADSLELRGP